MHFHTLWDLWQLSIGIGFIALAWIRDPGIPAVLRPTDVRFSDDGLDIDVAFVPPANRRYAWRDLSRIEDAGDAFVIVPKTGKRIVLPKRAFPDRGREVEAFFAVHVKT